MASAAPQTLIIYGANGTPGSTDPYTEFSMDGGATWQQAYLFGGHPWGFVDGTNSWVNCSSWGEDPACLNRTVMYRIRFMVPAGMTNPQMVFDVKADNFANIAVNGTQVAYIEGQNRATTDASLASNLHTGMNEIRLDVLDEGGWAGLNYKITLTMDAPTPPSTLPAGETPPPDTTAPTITTTRTPEANVNGWNNTEVQVSFACADTESDIASCTAPVLVTAEGANQSATGSATDTAGNTASATVSGINVDTTAATVSYTGNAGTYTVDQQVNITCAAADALSGVASDTCQNVTGPAYKYNMGSNTVSATATDKAGNVGTGSTSFTVQVTYSSLCTLTQQFLALNNLPGNKAGGIGNALCVKLDGLKILSNGNEKLKAIAVGAYINLVEAQSGKALTKEQAAILIRLAKQL